ncbi:MarR family transcriptional regulator [Mycolicibacter sp. MYC123]|uniref:MarR family transcriptional regulator n=1 Tax=[Mycobacterium] zoologicum TaxID=2872311 RepID=A0ABU5YMK2_9MYCO|nr:MULTISPECIES: MarR family transcriptional regulator [unclassified Mycolicibacter]MEB3050995.1 MarR family transcriptional regulator [Mycolicibacter sp. MYC123]MEB3063942.1 MarR family transcriptional regulator [Mycolicibacter sp. MYC101]
MATHWLSDDEQRMWRLYLESTRLLMRDLDRHLAADAGINMSDFEILVLLSEAPQQRMRMNELADHTVTTRSGVTRAVKRLNEAGWVRQATCAEDKRGLFAELTEAGLEKLQQAAPGHVRAVRTNLFDLLSPREVELFTHSYAQIRDNLLNNA